MFQTPPLSLPSMHDLQLVDYYQVEDHLWRILFQDWAANELYYLETPEMSHVKPPKVFPAGTWNVAPRSIGKSRAVPKHTPEMLQIRESDSAETHYVKNPELLPIGERLFYGPPLVHLTREVKACEFLRQHPHPNICAYHSVIVDTDGFVKGLVFDRYTPNLHDFVNERNVFEAKKVLSYIEAGIDHMHSLGLVHCEIKPQNIFVTYPTSAS
jgi:serine/threonine protein kinase